MRERFPTRLFLFAFLGWTFDFYDLVLLGFLKEPVGRDLHLTPFGESALLGVALGASGIGGIAAGALADRFGRRTLLSITVLVYSLGTLLCGLAPDATWFAIARAVTGVGVGGEWAIGHGMLAEAVPASHRGRASAALQAGEPFGAALAALSGFLVLPRVGWRAVMIGSSATALLAIFARRSVALPDERRPSMPLRALIHHTHIAKHFVYAWILGVLKMGTYWSCYTWLPSFLSHEMGQPLGRSLAFVLVAQSGQLAGMAAFGQLADRAGRRPAFFLYGMLTALALSPLVARFPLVAAHPALFFALMLLLGFGSGATAGFGALLAELFPDEIRATAMGATYNLARTAQLGAPILVGWAAGAYGLAGGLAVPLVLAVAMSLWVLVLPETRGAPLPSLARPDGGSASR